VWGTGSGLSWKISTKNATVGVIRMDLGEFLEILDRLHKRLEREGSSGRQGLMPRGDPP